MELVKPINFWAIEKFGNHYRKTDIFNCGKLNIDFLFYDRQNQIIEIYSADYMAYIFKNQIEERAKYFGTS